MPTSFLLKLVCTLVAALAAAPVFAPPPRYDSPSTAQQVLSAQHPALHINTKQHDHQVILSPSRGNNDNGPSNVQTDDSDPKRPSDPFAVKLSNERRPHLRRGAFLETPAVHAMRDLSSVLRRRSSSRLPIAHPAASRVTNVNLAKALPTYSRPSSIRYPAPPNRSRDVHLLRKFLAIHRADARPIAERAGPPPAHLQSQLRGHGTSSSFRQVLMAMARKDKEGLTFETCSLNEDCKDTRVCVDVNAIPNLKICDGIRNCVCFPTVFMSCESSSDCEDEGEVCAFHIEGGDPFCVSKRIIEIGIFPLQEVSDSEADPTEGPSPEPTEESLIEPVEDSDDPEPESSPSSEICIDARSLRHLSTTDLVFEKHAWANVLCDENDSCATEGHMVNFHGRLMRMKTYCGVVDCVERVMLVNSPRYSRGLLVKSNTEGLYFTALAARYNTRVEEAVLAVAIRAGL